MAKKHKQQLAKKSTHGAASARRAAAEFNPDYSDIKKDLKNIGFQKRVCPHMVPPLRTKSRSFCSSAGTRENGLLPV